MCGFNSSIVWTWAKKSIAPKLFLVWRFLRAFSTQNLDMFAISIRLPGAGFSHKRGLPLLLRRSGLPPELSPAEMHRFLRSTASSGEKTPYDSTLSPCCQKHWDRPPLGLPSAFWSWLVWCCPSFPSLPQHHRPRGPGFGYHNNTVAQMSPKCQPLSSLWPGPCRTPTGL